jgi:hypothetical protein
MAGPAPCPSRSWPRLRPRAAFAEVLAPSDLDSSAERQSRPSVRHRSSIPTPRSSSPKGPPPRRRRLGGARPGASRRSSIRGGRERSPRPGGGRPRRAPRRVRPTPIGTIPWRHRDTCGPRRARSARRGRGACRAGRRGGRSVVARPGGPLRPRRHRRFRRGRTPPDRRDRRSRRATGVPALLGEARAIAPRRGAPNGSARRGDPRRADDRRGCFVESERVPADPSGFDRADPKGPRAIEAPDCGRHAPVSPVPSPWRSSPGGSRGIRKGGRGRPRRGAARRADRPRVPRPVRSDDPHAAPRRRPTCDREGFTQSRSDRDVGRRPLHRPGRCDRSAGARNSSPPRR